MGASKVTVMIFKLQGRQEKESKVLFKCSMALASSAQLHEDVDL